MTTSRRLADLLPKVRDAAEAALAECRVDGLDVLVTCTHRDDHDQEMLYAQGRSVPGRIVTNARAGQSMHQYRVALDLVPLVHGKPDWNGAHPIWDRILAIFKKHGFELGAEWVHFKEKPHVQMTDGHPLSHFQAGGVL